MRQPLYLAPKAAVDPATTHRANVLAMLMLLALPFIQLGLTYWASVQGVIFLLVALFVLKGISRLQLLMFVIIAVSLLMSLMGHLYSDTLLYAFFRILRQILSLYLIVCAANTLSWRPRDYFFDVALPFVVVALSALVILQFLTYTLLGWTYLFLPAELFIAGFSTIADHWIDFAATHGLVADVRAAGTYAEPSYFGFIALSLAFLVLRGVQDGVRKTWLLGLMLVAVICSKSASGVVLYVLLLLFAFRQRLTLPIICCVLLVLALGLVGADLLLDFHLLERLSNITNPALEPSGYIRLILPLKHIALVLQHKPLGVPLSEFFTFTSQHLSEYVGGSIGPVQLLKGVSSGTDNGFLNLFVSFGLGGFVLVGLFPFIVKDGLILVFLLFVCQFNGDIFAPDKVAVIALVVSCRRVINVSVAPAKRPVRFTPPGPFGAMVPRRT